MQRKITINNKEIDYSIRKSKRARRLRVAVHCDASVVVTLPYLSREKIVEKFLQEKADWVLEKINYFNKYKSTKPLLSENDYFEKRATALEIVNETIIKYNFRDRFKFNKITIKRQKTRWGSCSRKGNININYRIVYLSREAAEYIVVHELCHLQEFNHSRNFWNLVGQFMPKYIDVKKELKKNHL